MKNRKTTYIILLLLITAFMSTACKDKEPSLEDIIAEKTSAYRTDMIESSDTIKDFKSAQNYILNWLNNKGLSYDTDKNGNIIISSSANEGYEDAEPTLILTSYDGRYFKDGINVLTSALYLIKNNRYGKLTLILTPDDGDRFTGLKKLSSSYLSQYKNVISLIAGDKALASLGSAGISNYTYDTPLEYKNSTGTVAINISITGLPNSYVDSKISSHLNPIKELASLLASFKTNVYIYDLASFEGGDEGNMYPSSASITIVINKDDLEKFNSRLTSEQQDFIEKYGEDYPEAKYQFTQVELPQRVFSDSVKNKIVGISYTILNGSYSINEDERMVSLNSISKVSTSNDVFKIDSFSFSISSETQKEIDQASQDIAALSDVNFKKTDSYDNWIGKKDSKLSSKLAEAYRSFNSKDLEYFDSITPSHATVVSKLNAKADIVVFKINDESLVSQVGAIETYLKGLSD